MRILFKWIFFFLILSNNSVFSQCFYGNGNKANCNDSFVARKDGIDYKCKCICNGNPYKTYDYGFNQPCRRLTPLEGNVGSTPSPAEQEKAAREAELKRLKEMERLKHIKDSIAQAEHDRMMKDYKSLDDSNQGPAFKTLESMNNDYKSLEGKDLDESAELARKQFEAGGDNLTELEKRHPTHFFGDDMSDADLTTLSNPEQNPEIVDLRESTAYLEENIRKDSTHIVQLLREYDPEGAGEPIKGDESIKIDCNATAKVLSGYYNQREQLFKSIQLSASQYENWSEMKDEALKNQVKEGFEFFLGELLSKLENRGKAAERLQGIFTKNKDRLIQQGADIAALESKINRLRKTAKAANIEHYSAWDDWTTFVEDGFSALIIELNSSNEEITAMINDPQFEDFFQTEAPILTTLLDITSLARDYELFGKAIAKKVPQFALAQLAISTAFNATQWVLSYKQMIEAENINGKLLNQSQQIQRRIDELSNQLMQCNESK